MMFITLCICTRNRPRELHRALQSACASLLPPGQILVSDDSDAAKATETAQVCDEFRGVEYMRGPGQGLSANRNHCLRLISSESEAIAFLDDDAMLHPQFLPLAAHALEQIGARTIITGRECKNGQEITPHNCSFWGHQEVRPRGANDYHTIVINATLFPRTLFDYVRFDERLRYGCEEADICAQAEASGYKIQFCPQLVNTHLPSSINRDEYQPVVEVSRLYSTYKRFRWLERRRGTAWAFACLAPLHLLGHTLRNARWRGLASDMTIIAQAARLARDYARSA